MPGDEAQKTAERLLSRIESLRQDLEANELTDADRRALGDWLFVASAFVADGAFEEARVTLQHVAQELPAMLGSESEEFI